MRIRTIKPEFFLHAELYDAEAAEGLPLRLAFIGLWCAADREGRFKWEPRRLKAQILPYDDGVDFSRVLHALKSRGFIAQYGPSGEFGLIPGFSKHQCPNIREAKSSLPDPAADTFTDIHVQTRADTCNEFTYAGVNIAPALREMILARDGRVCIRCGSTNDLTIDHILPQSCGGTHDARNLRVLCRSCNSRRPVHGDGLIEDLKNDGYTIDALSSTCMHVHARVEGKGKEGKGKEGERAFSASVAIGEVLSLEAQLIDPAPAAPNPDKSPAQLRAEKLHKKRESTPWDRAELTAWKTAKAVVEATTEEEWQLLEWFYPFPQSETYRRKELAQTLNNWAGEITKARAYKEKMSSTPGRKPATPIFR